MSHFRFPAFPAFPASLGLLMTVLAALLGLTGEAQAQPAAKPELTLTVMKLVPGDGKAPERFEPATAARVGDTLVYEATYRNPTAQTVRNAQVTLPVPAAGVEYLLDSASPSLSQASPDGRRFAALPLMSQAPGADGKPVQRPAPAAHYRYLRWSLGDLPAGASRVVRARVVLLSGNGSAS